MQCNLLDFMIALVLQVKQNALCCGSLLDTFLSFSFTENTTRLLRRVCAVEKKGGNTK